MVMLATAGTAARATRGEVCWRGANIPMSSANPWYVQTVFGAVLGPMPDDTLAEMARTAALLPEDLVRQGADGEWHPASSVPDLFDESSSVAGSMVGLASTDSVEPGNSTEPLGERPQPTVDLIASWKAERRHTLEQLGLSSLANESVTDNVASSEGSHESLPDHFVFESPNFESHKAESVATAPPKSPSPSIKRPSLLSQIAPRLQKPETFPQKWDRWKRSLPSWPIGIAGVVVLAMIWWYWPRSTRGIYDRYVEIWKELETRRVDFKDKEGWEEFLERSNAELNETVSWLETQTSSRDQEKQLLLWTGRDCLKPMLKRPRVVNSAAEKQLQQHLKLLGDFYSPTTSTEPRAVHVGAEVKSPVETDPEQSHPGVLIDPSLLRKSEAAPAESGPKDSTESPKHPGALKVGSRKSK